MAFDTRSTMQAAAAAHQSGRLSECDELCRQILAVQPRNADAKLLSGICAAKQGNTEAAISRLGEVARWDPDNFIALNWLSMLLREAGHLAEATSCSEQAVALRPNEPDALSNLGFCYLFQSRFADAVPCFERAIAARPNQPVYQFGLASALEPLGRAEDACRALRSAIRLAPNPNWLLQLGNLCLGEGDAADAVAACRQALELDAKLPLAHLVLSQALTDLGHEREADEHFQSALNLDPNPSELYKIRGLRLQSTGRFEEATLDFQKSVEVNPRQGFAYYGLVSSKRLTEADRPLVDRIEQVLADRSLDASETAYLHYALGKAFDNLGEYGKAMAQFDEANSIAKEIHLGNRPFDQDRFASRIDDTIRLFSKPFLDQTSGMASEADLPILIVGMMRSGTTLLEQILSCHPDIGAAGELSFWTGIQPKLVNFERGQVDITGTLAAGARYCAALESVAPGRRRVTDKNPANFFALGPVRLALPEARIVHMKRNPVDTCLSIYMTPIRNPPDFACDRGNIVFAYRQYQRLMEHWRSVIPAENFLEVSYEALIQNRETTTRQIVGFCGQEWSDKCLRPDENLRSIRTPSFWQARQSVYSTSLERWRRYKPWLDKFAELLSD